MQNGSQAPLRPQRKALIEKTTSVKAKVKWRHHSEDMQRAERGYLVSCISVIEKRPPGEHDGEVAGPDGRV